jgi:hypothetical protein
MTKIFSTNDPDAIERFREKNQLKRTDAGKDVAAARARTASGSVDDEPETIFTAQNRLMLRHERVLQGLLSVRDLFDRPAPEDRKAAELTALIEQTRFQDEPVLKDYGKTLQAAIRDQDRAAIDYLVLDYQNKLASVTRDRIIRENLTAASSLIPGDLLKDVVRSIQKEGLPEISIARQRVQDLLKNV